MSLNEMNALLSGAQVGMPSMPTFNTSQTSGGVNYSGAAQNQYQSGMDQYNAQQEAAGSTLKNIAQIGGTAAMFMSDARAKNIVMKLGKTRRGNTVYAYRYKFSPALCIGVIAQEVPHASMDVNGILHVDYSKV